ncbi:MAG: restriction endonuclease subunit S [Nitrospirae bacterium CG_4_10_14_3_um_filter_70_108]|nr:MAG: restriction endonuclease subunit S [Nitrospirae bacterium CG_4_10_14_3_um_filter_70_108]
MSDRGLPAIGGLLEPVSSWAPEREDPGGVFTYIDLSAVDQDAKVITGARELNCAEAPSRARQVVRAGDVLVSTVRPNLNGVARVPPELDGATASTGFCVLRPKSDSLDGHYLFQWVKSPRFVAEMVRRATGASYPAVSDRIVCESQLPLPSLPEQRRIAEILDKADALRAKRRATLAQLDTVTQSIFLDMFGDPATNPKGWPQVPIGDHASKIGSGATPRGGEESYKAAGITLIRSMNVRDGAFLRDGLAFIDDEQAAQLAGVVVEADDVLLNITGASVARVCRAPADVLPARVNQHVSIIRPTATFNPLFLEQCLLLPSVKEHLLKIARAGATREAITKSAIEHFSVIGPPHEVQDRFAARVAASERISGQMRVALGGADALFASLQHRAFRGEL